MRNPIYKRIFRDLKKDFLKNLVLITFLALPIAFISATITNKKSISDSYYNKVEKFNLEDAHFSLLKDLTNQEIKTIEDKNDVKLYKLHYKEIINDDIKKTYRIYNFDDRNIINKFEIFEGKDKLNNDEIIIERLFLENNKLNLNDNININKNNYKIVTRAAFIDYSTLFKSNKDSLFNNSNFAICLVNENTFNKINNKYLKYNYAIKFNKIYSDKEAYFKNKEITENIYKYALQSNNFLTDYVSRDDNNAINFAIDDLVRDNLLYVVFCSIIILAIAFIFSLNLISNIKKEAKVIGNLKALGFKNRELLNYYLLSPSVIGLMSLLLGNILSYTFFANLIKRLYYHTYSFPSSQIVFSAKALLITSIIPFIIIFIINFLMLHHYLKIDTLKFLHNDLRKNKNQKVIRLNKRIPFKFRYILRTIFQNKGTYFALLLGTILALTTLNQGLNTLNIFEKNKTDILNTQLSNYQTYLKKDIDIKDQNVQKLYSAKLNYKSDEIYIFGVDLNDINKDYLNNINIEKGKITLTNHFFEKYYFKKNNSVSLNKKYSDKEYKFIINDSFNLCGQFIAFLDLETFKNVFDNGEYLTCYLSNNKLNIDEDLIYKTISKEDLSSFVDQLIDSLTDFADIIKYISVFIFFAIVFLLSKIVIENNQYQISLLKLLGYKNRTINLFYNLSSGIVTLFSLVLGSFISNYIIELFFKTAIRNNGMSGWYSFYFDNKSLLILLITGISTYAIVYLFHSFNIKRISLSKVINEKDN
ncbi:MAG: FtsX-like permease family protein [Bacillales bacterium]